MQIEPHTGACNGVVCALRDGGCFADALEIFPESTTRLYERAVGGQQACQDRVSARVS
jgi:hypothetical protein